MTTIRVQGEVDQAHKLNVSVDCPLPPGPVDLIIMLQPREPVRGAAPTWKEMWGLGKEVWAGIDVQAYLDEMRADRELLR